MFIGLYRHQLDTKGRVAVPASFRKGLGDGAVISIGSEGRLVVRPAEEWVATERRYRMTSQTGAEERSYIRQLYASARTVELDAQGRLLLDAEHRRFARINDRAAFVGLGNVVEVVGEEVWDQENESFDPETFTQLGDRINTSNQGTP